MDWCAVSLIPFMFVRKDTDEINTTSNTSVSDADNTIPRFKLTPSDEHNQSRNRYRP